MTETPLTPLTIPPFSDVYNIPIPELWLSALVQHAVIGGGPAYVEKPIVYEIVGDGVNPVRNVPTKQTRSTDQNWLDWRTAFGLAFENIGPHVKNRVDQIAAAVEDELWTRTEADSARRRRRVRAAVPITPICAVLQNQIGVLGTTQYVDYGKAVESLYQVGKFLSDDKSDATANSKLQIALSDVSNQDERLAALDAAFLGSLCSALDLKLDSVRYEKHIGRLHLPGGLPSQLVNLFDANQQKVLHGLRRIGENNSFVWFYQSWNKLTDPTWYHALPYRRWIDWLVTSIRLSIGTAYLARSQWAISAAKYALRATREEDSALGTLINETFVQQPLSWPDRGGVSIRDRDVFPEIRKLIRTGISIRQVLESDDFGQALGDDRSVEGLRRAIKADVGLAEQLEIALLTPKVDLRHKVVQPVYNTVADALADKTSGDGSSESADYYALMKRIEDSFVIDPSSEVMALIATLACEQPDGFTSLGRVRREFQALGLEPSQSELRFLLERAGLCRSEADASLQVTVSSALRTASQL